METVGYGDQGKPCPPVTAAPEHRPKSPVQVRGGAVGDDRELGWQDLVKAVVTPPLQSVL